MSNASSTFSLHGTVAERWKLGRPDSAIDLWLGVTFGERTNNSNDTSRKMVQAARILKKYVVRAIDLQYMIVRH